MYNKLEITLNGIEWNDEFTIKLNNETAKITATNDTCAFYIDESGSYELMITQEESRKLYIWEKVICCLFALVQGIFYIFLFHTAEKWYEGISGYRIKKTFYINVQSDAKLTFRIKHGNVEELPMLECNHKEKIISEEAEYYPNVREFKQAFFHHFRKLSAIFVYLYAILIAIGVSAYRGENIGLFAYAMILFIIFAILHMCIYVKDSKRIKRLRDVEYEI